MVLFSGFKQEKEAKSKRPIVIKKNVTIYRQDFVKSLDKATFFPKVLGKRRKWYNQPVQNLDFIYFSRQHGYSQYTFKFLVNCPNAEKENFKHRYAIEKIFIGHLDELKDITRYVSGKTRIGTGMLGEFLRLSRIENITLREIRDVLNNLKSSRRKKKERKAPENIYSAVPPTKSLAKKTLSREVVSAFEDLLMFGIFRRNRQELDKLQSAAIRSGEMIMYEKYLKASQVSFFASTVGSLFYSVSVILKEFRSIEEGFKELKSFIDDNGLFSVFSSSVRGYFNRSGQNAMLVLDIPQYLEEVFKDPASTLGIIISESA